MTTGRRSVKRKSVKKVSAVSAVIVHFRTFDLTRMAVWSLKSYYPDMHLVVVENCSGDGSRERLGELAGVLGGVRILEMQKHVHHGPGMDAGIRVCDTPWVLVCDSDCIVYRPGAIDAMLAAARGDTYMVGEVQNLDGGGFLARNTSETVFEYVHPFFALVHREKYMELPPFEKHGSPCLKNEMSARERGFGLVGFPVREYVYHFGRGTVNGHGYGLGAAGQAEKLKRYYRRLIGMFRR
jgi:hypothetical protein